jgi:nitrate/nitrite-specific signal transduction histidine kinase
MIITDVLYVTDEMRIDKQKLIISLIKDITSVDEQRRTQYLSFIKTGALGFLVVVFITPIMSRFVMRSIQRLTEGVQDFSSGNYQFRFKVKGRDEIGILAHQFNIMAEEIEKRVKELEREGKV